MTHILATYHDLAKVTIALLLAFAFLCWATRNEGGAL